MKINEFQKLMKDLYFKSDKKRGVHRTALWLTEELGELVSLLKNPVSDLKKTSLRKNVEEEMADVYAWVASLANLLGINLEEAVNDKYPGKCPKCHQNPCICKK